MLIAIRKNAEPAPHTFTRLIVNEVSLVTDPAVFTKDEAKAGAGVVVFKSLRITDGEGQLGAFRGGGLVGDEVPSPVATGAVSPPPPEAAPAQVPPPVEEVPPVDPSEVRRQASVAQYVSKIAASAKQVELKKFLLTDGESLDNAVEKLVSAALTTLMNHLGDPDVWWNYYPFAIQEGMIVMMDCWASGGTTEVPYYKMTFSRGEDGAYAIDDPVEMRLQLVAVGDDAVSKVLTPLELAMKVSGIVVGDQVMKIKAAPGAEFGVGDTTVVTFGADGNHTVSAGWELGADGMVRKVQTPSVNISGNPSHFEVLRTLMERPGTSFKMEISPDGKTTIESGQPAPPVAAPAPVAAADPVAAPVVEAAVAQDELVAKVVTKAKALIAAQQQAQAQARAGASGSDPEAMIEAAVQQALGVQVTKNQPRQQEIGLFGRAFLSVLGN